jgi:murein DD-endopeptidase MepM/ murein hydrolase activator NlpD
VTEIRFQPGDARGTPRTFTLDERSLRVRVAAGALALLLVLGILGTPSLVLLLARSIDRLEARAMARRGAESLASVVRRRDRLALRLSGDELVLARLAAIASLAVPKGFPPDALLRDGSPASAEADVGTLARRVAADEAVRKRLATDSSGVATAGLPSRSPVEPSVAVPTAVFGPRPARAGAGQEFFPGLLLSVPLGTEVRAPAFGTVSFAGTPPARAGAAWRGLGLVAVISHGGGTWTVYGHLQAIAARRGQRLTRGESFARAGRSGLAAAPALHYEVRRASGGRVLPRDPRLFVLDGDWISAADARDEPTAPADLDLPDFMR